MKQETKDIKFANGEDISRKIIKLIHKYNRLNSIHTRGLAKNHDLSAAHLLCLKSLYDKGEMSMTGIARNNIVNMSTLTRIIDLLEQKDLIKRCRVSQDRRVITIALTANGISVAENSPPLLPQKIIRAIEKRTQTEREEIFKALETLDSLIEF